MYVLNALLYYKFGVSNVDSVFERSLLYSFTNAAFKKNEDSNIVKYDCILK